MALARTAFGALFDRMTTTRRTPRDATERSKDDGVDGGVCGARGRRYLCAGTAAAPGGTAGGSHAAEPAGAAQGSDHAAGAAADAHIYGGAGCGVLALPRGRP